MTNINAFSQSMTELGLDFITRNGNYIQNSGLFGRWPVTASQVGGKYVLSFFTDRKPDKAALTAMKNELPPKTKVTCPRALTITLKKKELSADPADMLRMVTALLDKYGLSPMDTCPYCGCGSCNTAAWIHEKASARFGLTHRACLQRRLEGAQDKALTNAESGSYLAGFIGALLGMIVGCIPSVLTGLFADTIYALLMALIPICSYFGYKLLGGKMNRVPLVLSIIMSVIGVYVMYSLLIIGYLSTEFGVTLREAGLYFLMALGTEISFLDITVDCITYFIFAALGVWFSWRIISRSAGSDISDAETELSLSKPWPPVAAEMPSETSAEIIE